MNESGVPRSAALGIVVFLVELVLLAVLVWAGVRLGSPNVLLAILLAVALPGIAVLVWGRWLAPRATRRFGQPARLITKLALFVIAAALLWVSGLAVPAAVFLVLSVVIVCWGERSVGHHERDLDHQGLP